jgi:hypothetical protein
VYGVMILNRPASVAVVGVGYAYFLQREPLPTGKTLLSTVAAGYTTIS